MPLGDLRAFTACSKSCYTFVERELHTRVRLYSMRGGCVKFIVQSTLGMGFRTTGVPAYTHTAWYANMEYKFIHRLSPFFERNFSRDKLCYTPVYRNAYGKAVRWRDACLIVHRYAAAYSAQTHWWEQSWRRLRAELAACLGRRQDTIMEWETFHAQCKALRDLTECIMETEFATILHPVAMDMSFPRYENHICSRCLPHSHRRLLRRTFWP